jgi:hypothetical protein
MSKKNNPMYELTESETIELKALWSSIRGRVEEQRDTFVWIKLCAQQARLSRNQMWMIVSTLANLLEDRTIPPFVYRYLDKQISEVSLEIKKQP